VLHASKVLNDTNPNKVSTFHKSKEPSSEGQTREFMQVPPETNMRLVFLLIYFTYILYIIVVQENFVLGNLID
jgi:hypothetical protein